MSAIFFAGGLHPVVALGDESNGMEEITVTARKREENLRDVPVAVTEYGEAGMERLNVKDVEDTYGLTPGLYFTGNFLSPGGDFRQLVIRGVGANSQLEPSVATFVDGVYLPSLNFDLDLLGVSSVEILKGPQGSLFGRNTEGGAVNITTRKPSEEVRGQVKFLIDDFNTAETSGFISGPLVDDKLFASAAVLFRQSDGFVRQTGTAQVGEDPFFPGRNLIAEYNAGYTVLKGADGQRQAGVRGELRYVPSDQLEVRLTGDFSQFEGIDQAPGPLASCNCYTVDSDQAFAQISRSGGFSGTINWTADWGTLSSITGWRRAVSNDPIDFDGTRERINNFQEFYTRQLTLSEELRASSSDDGPLKWLGGLYGFKDNQFSDRFYIFSDLDTGAPPLQALNGLWNQQLVDIDRKGWAIFGSSSYNVTAALELTVGGRWSWERANALALERYEIPANGVLPYISSVDGGGWPDFVTPVQSAKSWGNFSPQFSAKYNWSRDVMTYVTISQGFKAGSYQKAPVTISDVAPIDPEKSTNYELGLKSSLINGRLFFDGSIYYIQLKDQQLQAAVIRDGITASEVTNAAKSRVQGVEGSLTAKPTEDLTVWMNVGVTDSKFLDYQIIPDGVHVVDRSGSAFPNTPKLTYSASGEYRLPLKADDHHLVFNLTYRWVDSTYVGSNAVSDDPIIDVPSWWRLDASMSWEHKNSKLKLFADNLTNNYIILSRWTSFFVEPEGAFVHNRLDAPRRIGLSFTQNF